MTTVGQREIHTQRRVIDFFHDALGYEYLGNWKDREDNANIEQALLTQWLQTQGHSDKIITKVLKEWRGLFPWRSVLSSPLSSQAR